MKHLGTIVLTAIPAIYVGVLIGSARCALQHANVQKYAVAAAKKGDLAASKALQADAASDPSVGDAIAALTSGAMTSGAASAPNARMKQERSSSPGKAPRYDSAQA